MDAIGMGDIINVGLTVFGVLASVYASLKIMDTKLAYHEKNVGALEERLEHKLKNHAQKLELMGQTYVQQRHFEQVVGELREERKEMIGRFDRLYELILKDHRT